MGKKTFFQLLGIHPTNYVGQVKAKHRQFLLHNHPDKLDRPATRQEDEILKQVNYYWGILDHGDLANRLRIYHKYVTTGASPTQTQAPKPAPRPTPQPTPKPAYVYVSVGELIRNGPHLFDLLGIEVTRNIERIKSAYTRFMAEQDEFETKQTRKAAQRIKYLWRQLERGSNQARFSIYYNLVLQSLDPVPEVLKRGNLYDMLVIEVTKDTERVREAYEKFVSEHSTDSEEDKQALAKARYLWHQLYQSKDIRRLTEYYNLNRKPLDDIDKLLERGNLYDILGIEITKDEGRVREAYKQFLAEHNADTEEGRQTLELANYLWRQLYRCSEAISSQFTRLESYYYQALKTLDPVATVFQRGNIYEMLGIGFYPGDAKLRAAYERFISQDETEDPEAVEKVKYIWHQLYRGDYYTRQDEYRRLLFPSYEALSISIYLNQYPVPEPLKRKSRATCQLINSLFGESDETIYEPGNRRPLRASYDRHALLFTEGINYFYYQQLYPVDRNRAEELLDCVIVFEQETLIEVMRELRERPVNIIAFDCQPPTCRELAPESTSSPIVTHLPSEGVTRAELSQAIISGRRLAKQKFPPQETIPAVTGSDVAATALMLLIVPIIVLLVNICRRRSKGEIISRRHIGNLLFKSITLNEQRTRTARVAG